MRPKKIDLYILTEMAKPFLGVCVFVFFTLFLFQTLRLSDFLIVHHVPWQIVAKIAFCLLISFSPLVFPVSFLASVLVGFGRLSSDSELISMKACGISIHRIALPVLIFAGIVTAMSLTACLELGPWGERTMGRALYTAGNVRAQNAIQGGTFTNGFFDLVLYADAVNPKTGVMKNVFIFDERESNNPLVVIAPTGQIQRLPTENPLSSRNLLLLRNGSIHRRAVGDEPYQKIDFKTYQLYLKMDAPEVTEPNNVRILSAESLVKRMGENERHTQPHRDAATELWKRIATSFSPLLFTFLGMGMGIIRTRSTQSKAVLITFLAALFYWQAQGLGISLGTSGRLPPALAMEIPNIISAIAAVIAYRKATW